MNGWRQDKNFSIKVGTKGREGEREREREKKKWARVLTSVSGFQRNHTKIILYKGLQF